MIIKSEGKTKTEKILAELCNDTFLSTWSFPNPYNDKSKGKEFCDLIAIFEDHLFIFFDREKILTQDFNDNPQIKWDRWYKNVIEKQVKTCDGAERYIRTNGKLYIDSQCIQEFPIKFNKDTINIHKVIIANGAEEACKNFSKDNINGSLGITYRNSDSKNQPQYPFTIVLNKDNPIHVFDSHNFPIILNELDTFYDFVSYIVEKEKSMKDYSILSYSGEEDLLAHYFGNFNIEKQKHFIGIEEKDINGLLITEGEWNDFIESPAYNSRKEANKQSYFWDSLVQFTLDHALNDRLQGNSDIFNGQSALYEMAKEPRISRRMLSEIMIEAIQEFPINDLPLVRKMTYLNSFYANISYVFLQIKCALKPEQISDFRTVRQFMLEIACGAAKNKFPDLKKIIGIAMEPPILYKKRSEDFILFDCSDWTEEKSEYYNNENQFEGMRFFLLDNLSTNTKHVTEFPDSRRKS